jgi:hypothetical protein
MSGETGAARRGQDDALRSAGSGRGCRMTGRADGNGDGNDGSRRSARIRPAAELRDIAHSPATPPTRHVLWPASSVYLPVITTFRYLPSTPSTSPSTAASARDGSKTIKISYIEDLTDPTAAQHENE